MLEWVWFAGSERLKHLALMRDSAAARRFAFINLLWLALAAGVFQASSVGWRKVTATPSFETTGSVRPRGFYWYHLIAAPRPLPLEQSAETPVDLWWNPIQTLLGFVGGGVVALLLAGLALWLLRAGVAGAHVPPYRQERRMTAALRYSTAWCAPLLVAALVLLLRPVSYAGEIGRWRWYPPETGFVLSAAIVAGLAAVLWWFWWIRMSATAPTRTRSRVMAFWAVGAPVLVAGAACGWYFGLPPVFDRLFAGLRLTF
jgi:hypothetical protein